MFLSDIISALTQTIQQVSASIGSSVTDIFTAVFLTPEGGLSNLGTGVIVLFGIGLALGFLQIVLNIMRARTKGRGRRKRGK